jgi:hypothetical protein
VTLGGRVKPGHDELFFVGRHRFRGGTTSLKASKDFQAGSSGVSFGAGV